MVNAPEVTWSDEDDGPPLRLQYAILVHFVSGIKKLMKLQDFKPRNKISERLRNCLESRKSFVDMFDEIVRDVNGSSAGPQPSRIVDSLNTEPDADSHETDAVPVTVSRRIAREKMIGDCMKVHILNLIAPSEKRSIRPVDQGHVEKLKESFLSMGKQFKMLAVVFVTGDISKAEIRGEAQFEVIGGNHTRCALSSLFKQGLVDPHILVTVYTKDISLEEALSIALIHNEVDEQTLKMSCIDKARIIRNIKEEGAKWSNAAKTIFGFKTTTETRNKLRTMAAMADLDITVWDRIEQISLGWKGKDPIKQTAFTVFVTMEKTVQLELLDVWVKDGYKSYLKELNKITAQLKKTDTENVLDEDAGNQQRIPEASTRTTDQRITHVFEAESEKEHKLKKLEEENLKLKNQLQQYALSLEEKDNTIKKLREQLRKRILEDSELEVKQTNEVASPAKKRKGDVETNNKKMTSTNRSRKKNCDQTELQEGMEVLAKWVEKNNTSWLDAIIIKVLTSGKVCVRYCNDNTEFDVNRSWIRFKCNTNSG